MNRNVNVLVPACVLLAMAGTVQAQSTATATSTVSVYIPAKASIQIQTKDLTLNSGGAPFADYTGTTTFTYRVLTGSGNGSAGITLKVTTDFGGAGGPSVASPPTPGDTLSYTCTLSAPGMACTGSDASTTDQTLVGAFGSDVIPSETGSTGSVSWVLTNDPVYEDGAYSAVVTFTIHAV